MLDGMMSGETGVEDVSDSNATGAPPTGVRKSVASSTPVPVGETEREPTRLQKTVDPKRARDGKFQKALAVANGEKADDTEKKPAAKTDDGKTEPTKPEVAKTDAELRREKLQGQIAEQRARNEERKTRSASDQSSRQMAQREAELARREAHVAAELEKWNGVKADPVKGFQAMGLDVGQAFTQLAEAARTASTPEAKIDALQALIAAQNQQFEQFRGELQEREAKVQAAVQVAATAAAQRVLAEGEGAL